VPANKQLQRTVARWRGRGACASFHYALAARWIAQRAAAELRRYAAQISRLKPERRAEDRPDWEVTPCVRPFTLSI
jgi:hypothetical protein